MAQEAVAPVAAAADGAAEGDEEDGGGRGKMMRFMFQALMIWTVMQFMGKGRQAKIDPSADKFVDANGSAVDDGDPNGAAVAQVRVGQMRNLFGAQEECELFVHLSPPSWTPGEQNRLPLAALINETLSKEHGLELLWHKRVWYEANAPVEFINVTIPPLSTEALNGEPGPYILATLLRISDGVEVTEDHVLRQSLPLLAMFRELDANSNSGNLFGDDGDIGDLPKPKKNLSSPRLPYFKQKLEIRPVFDQTVHSPQSISQGPFRKLRGFPEQGFYQPYLYVSDFWNLEKDYTALNMTLEGQRLNLSLSYSVATALAWSIQTQMAEQWSSQGEWGLTDTQRDSFMVKRLCIDTNPYLLAFSGAFLMMHTLFSLLAFKNDIQFWRKNESMQGLSARSMVISFVCQAVTTLYLLDSQETSRLIVFNICLDTALSTWKLRKAVKIEFKTAFPFLQFGGQKGYESAGTSKYDEEAMRYMCALLAPLFFGYSLRSALYGKHRGWYSFLVGSAAGGVYTFGFAMMTPQLYINYKLKSVEHLPWRALTYKAMNTFVDDIAALLIDMPMMHRLSCFRDDVIFFVYIYQRWAYRVDKTRPSIYAPRPEEAVDASLQAASSTAPAVCNAEKAASVAVAAANAGEAEPEAEPSGDATAAAEVPSKPRKRK